MSTLTNFQDRTETAGKLAALLSAMIYIIGLVISSVYAGSLGIQNLALGNIRYVMTGALFLAFLITPAFIIAIPIMIIRGAPGGKLIKSFGAVAATYLFFSAVANLMNEIIAPDYVTRPLLGWSIYFVDIGHSDLPTIAKLAATYMMAVFAFVAPHLPLKRAAMVATPLACGMLLVTFTRFHYPLIRGAFGGAYWGHARIVVERDSMPPGIPVPTSVSAPAGISAPPRVSAPPAIPAPPGSSRDATYVLEAFVIEESDEALYVRSKRQEGPVYYVPRSRIRSVTYEPPEHGTR